METPYCNKWKPVESQKLVDEERAGFS